MKRRAIVLSIFFIPFCAVMIYEFWGVIADVITNGIGALYASIQGLRSSLTAIGGIIAFFSFLKLYLFDARKYRKLDKVYGRHTMLKAERIIATLINIGWNPPHIVGFFIQSMDKTPLMMKSALVELRATVDDTPRPTMKQVKFTRKEMKQMRIEEKKLRAWVQKKTEYFYKEAEIEKKYEKSVRKVERARVIDERLAEKGRDYKLKDKLAENLTQS